MKKDRFFGVFFLFVCLFVFNSCGLEEFYELDPPNRANHTPDKDTEYAQRYFDFDTNEEGENNKGYISGSSSFEFLGTAVYYKIYNNYSTMSSDISSISTASSSSNYSNAVTLVRETYKYQELGTVEADNKESDSTPLIKSTGSNQNVQIRITSYLDAEYAAYLKINGTKSVKIPSRLEIVNNKHKSFDFGRTSKDKDVYVEPAEGDSDYKKSSTASEENMYYVNMYAISVGRDTSYTNHYSNVLHLGSVSIDASKEDN